MVLLDAYNYYDRFNTQVDVTGASAGTACDTFSYYDCYCSTGICYLYQSVSSWNHTLGRWVFPILLGAFPVVVAGAAYYFTRVATVGQTGYRSEVTYTSAISMGTLIGSAIFGVIITGLGIWQWRFTSVDQATGFAVWGGVPVPMYLYVLYGVFFTFPFSFLGCSKDLTFVVLAILVAWSLASGVHGNMSAFYLYGVIVPIVALFDCQTMYKAIKPKTGKSSSGAVATLGNLFARR